MSILIDRNGLTPEQEDYIRNSLLVHPKPKFYQMKNRYASREPPIAFYTVEGNYYRVPFHFGFSTFNLNNDSLGHPPVNIEFRGTPRSYQVPIIQESLQQLQQYRTTFLHSDTGTGKTFMSIYILSQLKLLTLIMFTRKTLPPQWKKELEEYTNAKVWIVGEKLPQETNVILCMQDRIHKLPQQFRKMVGCLIIDEAHMFCTNGGVKSILQVQPKYIISCTATRKREDGKDKILDLYNGLHEIKCMPDIPFTVYKVNVPVKVETPRNKRGDANYAQLVTDITTNETFNRIILGIIEAYPQNKIMTLTSRVGQAKYLARKCKEKNIEYDTLFSNKNKYDNCRVLLGTIDKMGTGFDESNFCRNFDNIKTNILILAGSTKNRERLKQVTGRIRCRSDNPVVFDLVVDNPIMKKHYQKDRRVWYRKNKGTIHEIDGSCFLTNK